MRRLSCAFAIATILTTVGVAAAIAGSPGPSIGGRLTGTGPIFLVNPCNGENVTGTIAFAVTVGPSEDGNNTGVDIMTRYEAPSLTGDQGGAYELRATARASFDTRGEHYSLPMLLKVKGKLGSPTFTLIADMFVPVDDHQRPLNLPSTGYGEKCVP
jgi:hypothetical protein